MAWQGDLEKCYELIPFSVIIREAAALRFPAVVTYLAIDMYGGGRRIVADKVYSTVRHTAKAIVAGCSIATTMVKVCLRRVLSRIGEAFPRIIRRIFLDDLSLQWKGRRLERRRGGRGG